MTPSAMWQHCTVEQQLLLRLIGNQNVPGHSAELQSLVKQVHWDNFVNAIAPSLYPYIDYCLATRLPTSDIPAAIRHTMTLATRANTMQHLQRRAALKKILLALERQHIPVIVLKGGLLAWQVYPHPYTRTMEDLDLLVPHAQLKMALETLQTLSFMLPRLYNSLYKVPVESHFQTSENWVMQHQTMPIRVDLHTQLDPTRPPFLHNIEQIWAHSIPVSLDGLPGRTLAPEDFLEHLCLHLASRHRFEQGLRPLLDVLLYLERHSTAWDWPRLAATYQQHGSAQWMYLTLDLARQLLGAPVPEAFFAALEPPSALREVEYLALEQLWYGMRFRVPSWFYAMQTVPLPQLLTSRWRNLKKLCGEDLSELPTLRRMVRVARTALEYLGRMRLQQLQQAWRQGELAPARRQRAIQLGKSRHRISALMHGPEDGKLEKGLT